MLIIIYPCHRSKIFFNITLLNYFRVYFIYIIIIKDVYVLITITVLYCLKYIVNYT